jgi:hypothetical protein
MLRYAPNRYELTYGFNALNSMADVFDGTAGTEAG